MIIESRFSQGSDEWHDARIGNPGATAFSNIITSTGQPSKSRESFLYEIAEERIEGVKKPTFQTYAMKRGIEMEPDAKSLFSALNGWPVDECAMIYPDEKKEYHVSPDGIMPDRREGLEIKCPALKTHDKYLSKGVCPTEYRLQVQGSLMVTGYDRWWFVSYFPSVTPLIIPIERDEKLIAILRHEMNQFILDLNKLITRLTA